MEYDEKSPQPKGVETVDTVDKPQTWMCCPSCGGLMGKVFEKRPGCGTPGYPAYFQTGWRCYFCKRTYE